MYQGLTQCGHSVNYMVAVAFIKFTLKHIALDITVADQVPVTWRNGLYTVLRIEDISQKPMLHFLLPFPYTTDKGFNGPVHKSLPLPYPPPTLALLLS